MKRMDREKVIKALECCSSYDSVDNTCMKCPYNIHCQEGDTWAIKQDALALLKEHGAKQAIKQTYHVMMNRDYENPVEVTRYDWLCPTCKSLLCRDIDVIDDNYHFCKVCGQAVKWE